MDKIKIVNPGKNNTFIDEVGKIISPPKNWIFQPAGDAGITRKITGQGEYWRVQFKKGRRTISKGIWAPKSIVEWAIAEVKRSRSTDTYKKRVIADKERRDKKQAIYEKEFLEAVKTFLNFDAGYKKCEEKLASVVTKHAIPVGSGTVARTSMIPIEKRAAKAVIAWMRHKTTIYDNMYIPRIKGQRRSVRRELAEHSAKILNQYRRGVVDINNCPLWRALK